MNPALRALRYVARHPYAAAIVLFWALENAILMAVHTFFSAPSHDIAVGIIWSTVFMLVLWALATGNVDHRAHRPPRAEVSGAPALAFAAGCLACGLAWVYGVYIAYFALPLFAYCLGRLRAERKATS